MHYLADVNLWLASVVQAHPHHGRAVAWWRLSSQKDVRVDFCRITQLGLLRLLTNQRVMGEARQTHAEAWRTYDQLRNQPRIGYREELPGIEAGLRGYSSSKRSASGFWTDAYLAAFAQAVGLNIVTFDAGMRRFRGVAVTVLS